MRNKISDLSAYFLLFQRQITLIYRPSLFFPQQRPIVSEGGGDSSGQFDSYLSYALEPATHTGSEDSRQEKAAGRVLREEGGAAKHMQICLATDIRKGRLEGEGRKLVDSLTGFIGYIC